MKQSDIATHDDAYPFNCRACTCDPRPADDQTLWDEHHQDVKDTRSGMKFPVGTPLSLFTYEDL
jgi:hypothetical protein